MILPDLERREDPLLQDLQLPQGLRPGSRILVAMSGGLDSSMCAALLHRAGFEVVGVSMNLFPKGPGTVGGSCCTLEDFQGARKLAHEIGFPHFILDLEKEFDAQVIQTFAQAYVHGLTPSPCILCNQYLKFDLLMSHAREIGASHLATGHYARILHDAGPFRLHRSKDLRKDQSYFLFGLDQARLGSLLFPLGALSKDEVRRRAGLLELAVASKPESQDICFVPPEGYASFLEARGVVPKAGLPGPIRHRDGRILGTHRGHWNFTVGQRRGIGVAFQSPLYVIEIDAVSNTVWVGESSHLLCRGLVAGNTSWISGTPPAPAPFRCQAKVRSTASLVAVEASAVGDRLTLAFDDPQPAVAPGQAVVLYQGDEVLGGAWIEKGLPPSP
ncbi:MAG: tRNA 2-thiouridine(34) synthase MnmA [Acidobacteria bacterium]|nr:tRNA 2-thiouridine(34) synthase MnmA [Acidobacteriota bacterium]